MLWVPGFVAFFSVQSSPAGRRGDRAFQVGSTTRRELAGTTEDISEDLKCRGPVSFVPV